MVLMLKNVASHNRGFSMSLNSKQIFSLGAALASLTGAQVLSTEAQATVSTGDVTTPTIGTESATSKLEPNIHYRVGEDLLGFVMTQQPDGTLVAQHSSHASHASHASHHSHASSRY